MGSNVFKEEIEKLNKIDQEYNNLFDNNDFLDYDEIYYKLKSLRPVKVKFSIINIFKYLDYKKYDKLFEKVVAKFNNYKSDIDEHNKTKLRAEIDNFKKNCSLVEGKELDEQQIDAIVRKNKNQLVIAGAGSGKTTTIVGKVKYLLKIGKYNPEEILLLSFTNVSALEMKDRIKKETNVDLDVMTFHKLGLEIIKKSIGENIKIFDKELYQVIKELIKKSATDYAYFNKLLYFMSTARYNTKDDFDFKSEKEYKEYLKTNRPTTLKGEIVKSYGELEIANYLFTNNIEYIYEKEYEVDVMDDDHQQYKPDFYLPQYKIYIEYFGIDEKDEVAPFFKGKNGKTASETYNDSIKWKRKIHKKNNTTMIETFYYENKQGYLISNLDRKLQYYNVLKKTMANEEIWNIINQNNSGLLYEVCRVFETIINLMKSNNYSIDYLYSLEEVKKSKLNLITIDLIKPIYLAYQKELENNNSIDFNDMINLAIEYVENNKYKHSYKYVIVDEYQDISNSRYRLLKSMRTQKEYSLFCVGDDWQSIYRFNGSDIDLITNFEHYWGNTYISFIERTYRFTSMMSTLSGIFIMKNPRQFKKNINAKMSNDVAIKFINGYTEKNCIDFLEDKLYKIEKNSTIYMLGRYSFDVDIFKNNNNFMLRYNPAESTTEIIYSKRRDLKIKFITIHKSKGLQADYVVIINNKNYGMGFPSKINDLPIIKLLSGGGLEDYPYSEERRLFYVALTRAKKQTILLTVNNNKSEFVTEIENDYKTLIKNDQDLKNSLYTCPKCGGKLVPRKGKYGSFIGCSNYPSCDYTKNY